MFATPLPASLGIYAGVGDPGSATQNIGQMRNQGIELSLNSINLRAGKFQWTTTLNLTTNRNEVVSIYEGFGNNPSSLTPYSEVSVFPGEALGTYYLPEFAGYDNQGQMLVYELDQELKAEGITQRTGERIVIEGGQVNEHSGYRAARPVTRPSSGDLATPSLTVDFRCRSSSPSREVIICTTII